MKLNFELVPYTSWCKNLRSLLSEEDWDILRKQIYKKANHKCEICGKTNTVVHAHETWKYNISKKTQILTSVKCLCPLCHQTIHIGLAQVNNKFEESLDHYIKINKISVDKAHSELAKAYDIWEKRCKVNNWDINIDWLKENGFESLYKNSTKFKKNQ